MKIINSKQSKKYTPETNKELLTVCFDIIWDYNLQEKVVDEFFKKPEETAYELFFRIVDNFSKANPVKLSIIKNNWAYGSSSYPTLEVNNGEIVCVC